MTNISLGQYVLCKSPTNKSILCKVMSKYNNTKFDLHLVESNVADLINVDISDIIKIVDIGKNTNFYGIKENDLKIGDYVKIRVLKDDNNIEQRVARLTDIIPSIDGHSTFIYQYIGSNGDGVVNSYRGIDIVNTTSIKGIVDYFRPDPSNNLAVKSYTLTDIMKVFLSKHIIRKIGVVHANDKDHVGCYKIITTPYKRFKPGKWDKRSLGDLQHNKDCIKTYREYSGLTKTFPLRIINDSYNDEGIYFNTNQAMLINYKNNNTNFYRPKLNVNPLPFAPSTNCLIYGTVERNSEDKLYYNAWTIVTPQFLLFWTLIMYGNTNPTTANMPEELRKERLTLRTEQSILNNDKLSNEEKRRQMHMLSPFFGCADLEVYELFFYDMYKIITTYTMNQFKQIYNRAKYEYDNIGVFSKNIHIAAMTIANTGWYIFVN